MTAHAAVALDAAVAMAGLRMTAIVYCRAETAARFVVGWTCDVEVAPGVVVAATVMSKRRAEDGEIAVFLATAETTYTAGRPTQ